MIRSYLACPVSRLHVIADNFAVRDSPRACAHTLPFARHMLTHTLCAIVRASAGVRQGPQRCH